jgi:hypothetical protein
MHMGMDGTNAFPSQQRIASMAGLSLKAVKTHMALAQTLGWIERSPRMRGAKGSYRFGTDYIPRFPLIGEYGEPDTPKQSAINPETFRAPHASIGESGSTLGTVVPSLGNDGATNSSITLQKNSSVELSACKKDVLEASLQNYDILERKAQALGITRRDGESRGQFALRVAMAEIAKKS